MDSTVLHRAARRHLAARFEELSSEYGRLPAAGQYTTEAKQIFPRYHVVAAILLEVERLDPDRLPDADAVAGTLLAAAECATSPFTEPPHDEVQAQALADERRLFADQVRQWTAQPGLRADPLPYRRVLTPAESSHWRTAVQQRWGVRGGRWHPLLDGAVPPDVLVLTDDCVDRARLVLRGLGRVRVVELGEDGTDYLLDTFVPRYSGLEGLWTDEHHDWIAYASHEGTVAFGGVLAAGLRAA